MDIPPNQEGLLRVRGYMGGVPDVAGLTGLVLYLAPDSTLIDTQPAPPNDVVVAAVRVGVDSVYVFPSQELRRQHSTKSYNFTTQGIGAGTYWRGGYYDASTTSITLTQASLTQTYGTANNAYSAHPFIVCAGGGTTDAGVVGLRVTGTAIDDAGNLTTTDADTIITDITSCATNIYHEAKKFVGTVTYELIIISGTPTTYSFSFNYGYSKYEDVNNQNFYVTGIEAVGLAAATDNNFELEVLHHKPTGWTYAATGFEPGNGTIASMTTDLAPYDNLTNGIEFAWKRTNLNTYISGADSEGVIIKIVTGANNSVQSMDIHLTGELITE
jgi:hypothetical protein